MGGPSLNNIKLPDLLAIAYPLFTWKSELFIDKEQNEREQLDEISKSLNIVNSSDWYNMTTQVEPNKKLNSLIFKGSSYFWWYEIIGKIQQLYRTVVNCHLS